MTATATASSTIQDDHVPPNPNFVADKIKDGDPDTRWNSKGGDVGGSSVMLTWPGNVTFNKVAIDEAFDRIESYEIQVLIKNVWKTAYNSSPRMLNPQGDGNPILVHLFPSPMTTRALRLVFHPATAAVSLFEVRVYNVPVGMLTGTVRRPLVKGEPLKPPIPGVAVEVTGGEAAETADDGTYSLTVEAGVPTEVAAYETGFFRRHTERGITPVADAGTTQNFTLDPYPPDQAKDGNTEASSEESVARSAEALADGDYVSRWSPAADNPINRWIGIDWGTYHPVNTIRYYDYGGHTTYAQFVTNRPGTPNTTFSNLGVLSVPAPKARANRVLTLTLFDENYGYGEVHSLYVYVTDSDSTPSVSELTATHEDLGTLKVKPVDAVTGDAIPETIQGLRNARLNIKSEVNSITSFQQPHLDYTALPPGEYLINVTANGYLDSEMKAVEMEHNGKLDLTFPMTPLGLNLARNSHASASSENGGVHAASAIDGSYDTLWRAGKDTETGNPLTTDQWIALNFDDPVTLNIVGLGGVYPPPIVQKAKFQRLDGNSEWVDLPGTAFNPEKYYFSDKIARFVLPQPVTTKGIRYVMGYTNSLDVGPFVSELELYNTSATSPPLGCKGDVTEDHKIDVSDVVALLQHTTGLKLLAGEPLSNADVNEDGAVNVNDAVKILQFIVSLPGSSLPPCDL